MLQWMAVTPLPLFLATIDTEGMVQRSIELLWTRQDATKLAWPRTKMGWDVPITNNREQLASEFGPGVLSLYRIRV